MVKKVAIIYFGLLRSYDKVYKSHLNKILNILSKNNIEFKIFLHTWRTINDTQRVWGNNIEKKQNYEQINLMNAYKIKIDNQNNFETKINFSDYFYEDIYNSIGRSPEGEWLPMLIRNHLCALESQKRCFEMVEKEAIDFDYVMFLRPDVLIKNNFPISKLESLKENEILIPKFDKNEGLNDRFAVMNYKYAKYYAYRIQELVNYRKNHGRIVSEKYTKYIVKKYFKLKLIKFSFKIIRP